MHEHPERAERHVVGELVEFLSGENLHEFVDFQEDSVQVQAADGVWQVSDHPP